MVGKRGSRVVRPKTEFKVCFKEEKLDYCLIKPLFPVSSTKQTIMSLNPEKGTFSFVAINSNRMKMTGRHRKDGQHH